MKIIKHPKTGELQAVLSPGEKQYLCSTNLKNIAPAAHAKVKANGARRWRKRMLVEGIKELNDIVPASKEGSTKGH